jgi:glucan phosphoethanolaminetransferase (alkaline phosphatase superfamily)
VEPRLARFKRALLGDDPRRLLPLLAPTVLALALDLVLRARLLAGFRPAGKLIYASALLVGAALWFLPMWLAARLWATQRRAVLLWFAAVVFPLATLAYAGQALYYRVFHAYVGRDTVRVGLALRGTVGGWLVSWGSPGWFAVVVAAGALLAYAFAASVRRVAPYATGRVPLLAVPMFGGALVCLLVEGVDSRFLQAATPDVCFAHGAVHALVAGLTGDVRAHQGMSVRTPQALPPLAPRARPVNVVVVLTESVRADAMCSLSSPSCASPFLDVDARERLPLGRLTTQAPNTFTACMILWTGLAPNADIATAHSAPVLWEIARASGYRTAYVTAQNTSYENFSAFVQTAGIDRLVTAGDLGGMEQEHLGAPDERAVEEGLRFAQAEAAGRPYFEVVHLSNTHAPYRNAPDVQPFAPAGDDPLGDPSAFHNRYKNAVRLQERTLAAFVRELRKLPSWDDTALVVLSDHGEQFREHGAVYHNHSLFEQELRIPGWLLAGANVLSGGEKAALAQYTGTRTYLQDVHATIVDLLGSDRATLPFADPVARSLVRARPTEEPFVLLATTSAVWEPDIPLVGALHGDRKVVGPVGGGPQSFSCLDLSRHPSETVPAPDAWCAPMIARVGVAFRGR